MPWKVNLAFHKEFEKRNKEIAAFRQLSPPLTYQEIGNKFGISKERVRQILAFYQLNFPVKNPLMSKECEKCGKVFEYQSSLKRKFCSNDCKILSRKLYKTPEQIREQNRLMMRRYYQTSNGKKAIKQAIATYQKKNSLKLKAWKKVARLKVKIRRCEICGDPKALRHHPNYSKPLEVRFLCHLHHKQVHQGIVILT